METFSGVFSLDSNPKPFRRKSDKLPLDQFGSFVPFILDKFCFYKFPLQILFYYFQNGEILLQDRGAIFKTCLRVDKESYASESFNVRLF